MAKGFTKNGTFRPTGQPLVKSNREKSTESIGMLTTKIDRLALEEARFGHDGGRTREMRMLEEERSSKIDQLFDLKERREELLNEIRMFTLMPMPDEAFVEGFSNQQLIAKNKQEVAHLDFMIDRLEEEEVSEETSQLAEEIIEEFKREL